MAGTLFTSKSTPVPYTSFSGGLNSTSNGLSLQDNELRDVQNVDYDKYGSVLKRNGYSALNTSAFNSSATWTSLHLLELSSGTDYLMGTCGNKLAKMDTFDGTWDDITGSLTITAGNRMRWITFKDAAYGTNNQDVPIKWTGTGNGSTWTVVTNMTRAKYTETFENYAFLANVLISGTRHATRVYWSCINDPECWVATDFNEIGYLDGQEITGLKALGDRLVIFKERSIWWAQFTGSSEIPFIFQRSFSDVGCVSGDSIQAVDNGLMFASHDGVYWFDGNNSIKLSNKVTTTIGNFKQSAYTSITSAYQQTKNRYWASYQTSAGANLDRVLTFDTYNKAFSVYKGIAANCYVVLVNAGVEKIYFGDFSGFVYQADTGSNDDPLDVATAIDAYARTKWYHFGDLVERKGVPNVVVYYECTSSTLTFAYTFDLQDGDDYTQTFSTDCGGATWDSGVWDTAVWGRTGGNQSRRDLSGRGRVISFKFANSTLSEDFQIHGIGAYAHLETQV